MIELTVGLPLYKGSKIAWLALESLMNQKDIDFDWELIIIEDNVSPMFGKEQIDQYTSKLLDIGCVNIKYMKQKQIKLNVKWVNLAHQAAPTSKVFVFQAQDVYSFPTRLQSSHDVIMKNKKHWFEMKTAMFYDIISDTVALYDNTQTYGKTGLCLAMDIGIVKQFSIKPARMNTGLDYQMLYEANKMVSKLLRYHFIHPPFYGLETNGISYAMNTKKRSEQIKNFYPPFYKANKSDLCIPNYIMDRLFQLHKTLIK